MRDRVLGDHIVKFREFLTWVMTPVISVVDHLSRISPYLQVRNKTPPNSKNSSLKKVGGVLFDLFKNVSRMLFSTQGSIGMVKTDKKFFENF